MERPQSTYGESVMRNDDLETIKYGYCVQGKDVYSTGRVEFQENVLPRSLLVQAHVCDGCRDKGGEIHIGMIDNDGNSQAICFPPEHAGVLASQILTALSHLPKNVLDASSAGETQN